MATVLRGFRDVEHILEGVGTSLADLLIRMAEGHSGGAGGWIHLASRDVLPHP